MGRSVKKGPYVNEKLLKKVSKQQVSGARDPIKTWARASMIAPEFVGHNFAVHDGHKFVGVFVTESMVGHKFGEFAPTRVHRGHSRTAARPAGKKD